MCEIGNTRATHNLIAPQRKRARLSDVELFRRIAVR